MFVFAEPGMRVGEEYQASIPELVTESKFPLFTLNEDGHFLLWKAKNDPIKMLFNW